MGNNNNSRSGIQFNYVLTTTFSPIFCHISNFIWQSVILSLSDQSKESYSTFGPTLQTNCKYFCILLFVRRKNIRFFIPFPLIRSGIWVNQINWLISTGPLLHYFLTDCHLSGDKLAHSWVPECNPRFTISVLLFSFMGSGDTWLALIQMPVRNMLVSQLNHWNIKRKFIIRMQYIYISHFL